jgi:glycosyltransferase involved in cell wall biosynthesis
LKVAVIIPDRGDRPQFLINCLRMVKSQTIQADILLANNPPESPSCDITKRYRESYEILKGKGYDIIAFIENDDWYSPHYLEYMISKWTEHGKPDIFGTDRTIYYNIRYRKYFTMYHKFRASAMNTLIKPDLKIEWCKDEEAFTDVHLWRQIQNQKLFHADQVHSIGIKHGVGKCGAKCHTDRLNRYTHDDPEFKFLESTIDQESFNFYSKLFI